MSKLILRATVLSLLFLLAGCGGGGDADTAADSATTGDAEKATSEHPASEHPATDKATSEHPAGEHPAADKADSTQTKADHPK